MYFSSSTLALSLSLVLLLLSEKDMMGGMVLNRMYGEVESRGKSANPGSPGRIAIKPACMCEVFNIFEGLGKW